MQKSDAIVTVALENQSVSQSNLILTDHNKNIRDNSGKIVFGDNILCAQFLRGFVPVPLLKSVQPEDIEDVSERYIPLFTSEREADVVKKIHLQDEKTVYLISLIEHKTEVDYNVIMQLLRYMIYIWEDYEKEMLKKREEQIEREKQGKSTAEEKILTSAHKEFKYPPIIPIVYYEGRGEWTAAMNLKDRIYLSDIFEAYIPDYEYVLMRLHDYSNEQLMEHGNEMSLILLLNKLQSLADLEGLSELKDYQQNVIANTPEHLLDIIATITTILLTRLKLPAQEIEEYVSLIKEKKMPELFEKFEEVDVPKMRQEIAEQREELREERRIIQEEKRGIQEEKRGIQKEKRGIQEEKRVLQEKKRELQEEKRILEEQISEKIMAENIRKMFRKGYSPDNISQIFEVPVETVIAFCHPKENDFGS